MKVLATNVISSRFGAYTISVDKGIISRVFQAGPGVKKVVKVLEPAEAARAVLELLSKIKNNASSTRTEVNEKFSKAASFPEVLRVLMEEFVDA